MPLEHLSTNLCDYLIRADTGRFSLIGLFTNIEVRELPALKDPMGIVVQFRAESGDPYRIVIEGPGIQRLLDDGVAEAPMGLREYQQWALTATFEIRAAVFAEEGVYAVVLSSGETEVHRHSFGVIRAAAAEEDGNE